MAGERLKIHATQEDIDEGERFDCTRCPIARALLRTATPEAYVSVGGGEAYIRDVAGSRYYAVSRAARRFIALFDTNGRARVSPATFVFRLIQQFD